MSVLIENRGGRGACARRRGERRKAPGMSMGKGGGAKYFFFGAEIPTKVRCPTFGAFFRVNKIP